MPHASPLSDEELIARARDGDPRAFQRLVERYEEKVAGTVISMVGRGAEADDIGQETFIRFYKAMDQFRGDANLGTYLTRIAINQSLKAIRRRKRWHERFFSRDADAEVREPAVEGSEAVDRWESRRLVQEALQQLSPDHRAVVVLRMLEGYSTKEAAEILDVPEGTVMSRLYRAMDQLEEQLRHLV